MQGNGSSCLPPSMAQRIRVIRVLRVLPRAGCGHVASLPHCPVNRPKWLGIGWTPTANTAQPARPLKDRMADRSNARRGYDRMIDPVARELGGLGFKKNFCQGERGGGVPPTPVRHYVPRAARQPVE